MRVRWHRVFALGMLPVFVGSFRAAAAPDVSTATILATIEKGSRAHLERIQTGRGVADVEDTRIYPPFAGPKSPGGAVYWDESRRPGVTAGLQPGTAPATPGGARRGTTTTVVRSERISFTFKGNNVRWDIESSEIQSGTQRSQGTKARRALIGGQLIEYLPEADHATTRTFQPGGLYSRTTAEPFDPLHYGVKSFGQPLDQVLRKATGDTSLSVETMVEKTAEGQVYVVAIAPVRAPEATRRLWIDPRRGYTISRYEAQDAKGRVLTTMRASFKGHKNNVWVPASVEHETFDSRTGALQTRQRIVFTEFVPNALVKDQEFTLQGMGATDKTRRPGQGPGGRTWGRPPR